MLIFGGVPAPKAGQFFWVRTIPNPQNGHLAQEFHVISL